MNDSMFKTLKQLRLSGLAQGLDIRLHEAQSHALSHAEFLELFSRTSCRCVGIGNCNAASRPPNSGS